jgi:hypothetical protein
MSYSMPVHRAAPGPNAVLGLGRACEDFNLSPSDFDGVAPTRYVSAYGNAKPVWTRAILSGLRTAKRAREEKALEEQHGGAEALAAHRAAAQKAQAKQGNANTAEHLRDEIAGLLPGCLVPEAMPGDSEHLNKTNAKKKYFLTDTDLKKMTGDLVGATLYRAAVRKHGAATLQAKRQTAADKLAAARRAPLEARLASIEAAYPDLKKSPAELADRAAAKLDEEATRLESIADSAVAAALAARKRATKAARTAGTSSSSAAASAAVPAAASATKSKKRAAPAATPLSSRAASKRPKAAKSYCESEDEESDYSDSDGYSGESD